MPMKKEGNFYLKQVFGRDSLSFAGYCDKAFEFVIRDSSEIIEKKSYDSPHVHILGIKQIENENNILSDILDVLKVSPREMLKLISLPEPIIEEAFEFFQEYAQENNILCNMIINQASFALKQSAEKNPRITQEVVRVSSGHQILFIIPYHRKVSIQDISTFLINFVHGNHSNPWLDEKPSNFIIKIDFDEQQMFPFDELEKTLNSVILKDKCVKTIAILDNPPSDSEHNNKLELDNMYHLKKAMKIIKAGPSELLKPIEKKHKYDRLFNILVKYSEKISEHETALQEGPPYCAARLGVLYWDLSAFYDLLLPYLKKSFEYNLPIKFLNKHDFFTITNTLDLFSLRKLNDKYIVELNESNDEHMMNSIFNTTKILVTPQNFEYLADVYVENDRLFQWLLDSRKQASGYPMIITTNSTTKGEIKMLVGKAKPSKSSSKCNCEWCTTVPYWICTNCHQLLTSYQSNQYRCCGCGDNYTDDIQFYCFSKWKSTKNKSEHQVPPSTISHSTSLASKSTSSGSASSSETIVSTLISSLNSTSSRTGLSPSSPSSNSTVSISILSGNLAVERLNCLLNSSTSASTVSKLTRPQDIVLTRPTFSSNSASSIPTPSTQFQSFVPSRPSSLLQRPSPPPPPPRTPSPTPPPHSRLP